MRPLQLTKLVLPLALGMLFLSSACVSSKNLENCVSEQFNDQLPRIDSKKKSGIVVKTSILSDNKIAHCYRKNENILPLLVYIQAGHTRYTDLNPAIPVSYFMQVVQSDKGLNQKLNGRPFELTVSGYPSRDVGWFCEATNRWGISVILCNLLRNSADGMVSGTITDT